MDYNECIECITANTMAGAKFISMYICFFDIVLKLQK